MILGCKLGMERPQADDNKDLYLKKNICNFAHCRDHCRSGLLINTNNNVKQESQIISEQNSLIHKYTQTTIIF